MYICVGDSSDLDVPVQIHNPIRFLLFAGNGEIDFYEFLNLMTNTERFLEGFGKDSLF